MLERPDISDDLLIRSINSAFLLEIDTISFLPLGADAATAVFRATSVHGAAYFVKLRNGPLFKPAVAVPHLLATVDNAWVIPPLETPSGELWTTLDAYSIFVSPFVAGASGFEKRLTRLQWHDLGSTLAALHCLSLPEDIRSDLHAETFSSRFRDEVRFFQRLIDTQVLENVEAVALAELMREHRLHIDHVLQRASELAEACSKQHLHLVACHGDIHAGNVIVRDDGQLLVTDWDTLSLAPKERDLMFIGAGIGPGWNTVEESELFYAGYGEAHVNDELIAYYRWERIVQDIAEFCRQLLLNEDGGDDRRQALTYFASQFLPGSVVDMAYQADSLASS